MIIPTCAGNCVSNCNSTDIHAIDTKGYVYCEKHHFRGRKLTKSEKTKLINGLTIKY